MRHLLRLFDYPGKAVDAVAAPDPLIVGPAAEIVEIGEQFGHFPPLSGATGSPLDCRRGHLRPGQVVERGPRWARVRTPATVPVARRRS
jgi:hypothetical protein